jgi:hypothetical protein
MGVANSSELIDDMLVVESDIDRREPQHRPTTDDELVLPRHVVPHGLGALMHRFVDLDDEKLPVRKIELGIDVAHSSAALTSPKRAPNQVGPTSDPAQLCPGNPSGLLGRHLGQDSWDRKDVMVEGRHKNQPGTVRSRTRPSASGIERVGAASRWGQG